MFEDNALLAFYGAKRSNQPLDISIVRNPTPTLFLSPSQSRAFYLGNPPAVVRQTLDKPVETPEALFADRGTLLPAVTVRATARTPAEQFDAEHVTGLFHSADERSG